MGKNQGFILLPRNTRDDPLYTGEPFTRWQAFVDLVMAANHCEKSFLLGYEEVSVSAGDVVTSEQRLADRWRWSRDKVRRFLRFLERRGDIIRKADNKKTIITIVAFSDYQTIPHKGDFENSQTDDTGEALINTGIEGNRRTKDQASINLQAVPHAHNRQTADKPQTIHDEFTNDSLCDSLSNQLGNPQSDSRRKSERFAPPSLEEVEDYCAERGNKVDAQRFFNYYESNGWRVGKNSMKNWKAAVRTWETNELSKKSDATTDPIDAWLKGQDHNAIFVPCEQVKEAPEEADTLPPQEEAETIYQEENHEEERHGFSPELSEKLDAIKKGRYNHDAKGIRKDRRCD